MKFIVSLIFSFIFLFNAVVSAESKYSIHDLGTLQSDNSRAVAISNRGHVVGYYTWKGATYTFFWDPQEGIILVDIPKEYFFEVTNFQNYNPNGRFFGIMRSAKNKQAIGRASWERNCGYNLYTPKLQPGNKLKEILFVSLKLIGIQNTTNGQEFYFHDDGIHLPIIYGDLGLPVKITRIVDSSQLKPNSSEGFMVANCLYPIVNKGEIVNYVERSIFWDTDYGWRVNKICPENVKCTSMSMNNNGEVICDTDDGWKLVNLKENSVKNHRKFGFVVDFNNKGFFITEKMELVETIIENGEIGKLHLNFGDPKVYTNFENGFWKKICAVNAINDAGYVVGEAETVYGEIHAVLLVPEK